MDRIAGQQELNGKKIIRFPKFRRPSNEFQEFYRLQKETIAQLEKEIVDRLNDEFMGWPFIEVHDMVAIACPEPGRFGDMCARVDKVIAQMEAKKVKK
jgi:hypothetical protein